MWSYIQSFTKRIRIKLYLKYKSKSNYYGEGPILEYCML